MVAFVASVVAVVVACTVAVSSFVDDLFEGFAVARDTVEPVPVPAEACPYLKMVRVTSEAAAAPWLDALPNAPSDPVAWNAFSARLSTALALFDATLHNAAAHVPEPIADDLRFVEARVVMGRAALPLAHSYAEYSSTVTPALFDGVNRLSHAGALAGGACGFRVAPLLFGPDTSSE
jgi:hypothetical protein